MMLNEFYPQVDLHLMIQAIHSGGMLGFVPHPLDLLIIPRPRRYGLVTKMALYNSKMPL